MRAHYLQHVPYGGLGSIEPWLLRHGYEITCTRLYAFEELPAPDAFDFLIIMGGPMSVNDEAENPWLADEKQFVRTAVESGKPVLGICLGAQLIAASLGETIFPNDNKEIGWYPVMRSGLKEAGVFHFPSRLDVFHWHGETFTLPSDARLLAESEGCRHQAFQIGPSVIGLQFHLETTSESARILVENCRAELVPGRYVQRENEILSVPSESYDSIHQLLGEILVYLTGMG